MHDWFLKEQNFLKAYDNKEDINERCLLEYIYEGKNIYEDSDGRWSRTITTVFQVRDRYFMISWEHGLTESQSDDCYEQPVEVIKQITEKAVPEHTEIIEEWIELKRAEPLTSQ